jgi:hypothetical protein
MPRRRSRAARSYRRRPAVREPYDVVLIVCEGEKTEPGYLQGLKNAYRLSSANITIVPGEGNDPVRKAMHSVFEDLQPRINIAIANAERLARHNEDSGAQNPATRVHDLVKYLRDLKE